jgi:acetoin utilization deacetylase AcuC-like enzyme
VLGGEGAGITGQPEVPSVALALTRPPGHHALKVAI